MALVFFYYFNSPLSGFTEPLAMWCFTFPMAIRNCEIPLAWICSVFCLPHSDGSATVFVLHGAFMEVLEVDRFIS